jgi:hypothetical protein
MDIADSLCKNYAITHDVAVACSQLFDTVAEAREPIDML